MKKYKSKIKDLNLKERTEQFNNIDSLKYFNKCSVISANIWSKNDRDWAITINPKKAKLMFTPSKELYIESKMRISEKAVIDISVFWQEHRQDIRIKTKDAKITIVTSNLKEDFLNY